MTKEEFQKLTEEGIVILDGATGSNLRAMGMPVGICTELWVLEHKETIQSLQRAYAQAGSQIVYAPTFSANRISMALHNYDGDIAELNKKLVAVTREAVGHEVLVAGDMTTTGRLLEPAGDITYQEMFEAYQEQAKALAEAGVDLIGAETMLNVDETVVLLDAVQSVTDLPVICTLTVEADGTALYGGNAVEAVETLQEMGASAVGINCSVGPDQLEAVVASMKRAARVPVIAKPNAGLPVMDEFGTAHYSMDPDRFAASMKKLVEDGAGIVGGCCGTTPEHIRLLVQNVRG